MGNSLKVHTIQPSNICTNDFISPVSNHQGELAKRNGTLSPNILGQYTCKKATINKPKLQNITQKWFTNKDLLNDSEVFSPSGLYLPGIYKWSSKLRISMSNLQVVQIKIWLYIGWTMINQCSQISIVSTNIINCYYKLII